MIWTNNERSLNTHLIVGHGKRDSGEKVTGNSIKERDIMGEKLGLIYILDGT